MSPYIQSRMEPGPLFILPTETTPSEELLKEILRAVRENHAFQMASVQQQNHILQHMNRLNQWGSDEHMRRHTDSELQEVCTRIDQLRDDLHKLRGQFRPRDSFVTTTDTYPGPTQGPRGHQYPVGFVPQDSADGTSSSSPSSDIEDYGLTTPPDHSARNLRSLSTSGLQHCGSKRSPTDVPFHGFHDPHLPTGFVPQGHMAEPYEAPGPIPYPSGAVYHDAAAPPHHSNRPAKPSKSRSKSKSSRHAARPAPPASPPLLVFPPDQPQAQAGPTSPLEMPPGFVPQWTHTAPQPNVPLAHPPSPTLSDTSYSSEDSGSLIGPPQPPQRHYSTSTPAHPPNGLGLSYIPGGPPPMSMGTPGQYLYHVDHHRPRVSSRK